MSLTRCRASRATRRISQSRTGRSLTRSAPRQRSSMPQDKTVMAGAVEIHAHIAGPKVNLGRIYRPEDKLFTCTPTKGMERMGGGASIPTTFKTGYEYAKMGYTVAMEAAMPPLFARHVHEEIRDTPIIDEGAFPVFGNNWFVLEYLKNQEIENTAAYCRLAPEGHQGLCYQGRQPRRHRGMGLGTELSHGQRPRPVLRHHPCRDHQGPYRGKRVPRPARTRCISTRTTSGTPGATRPRLIP